MNCFLIFQFAPKLRAKYKTYLPDREELLREIDRQKAIYLLAANGDKRDSN